MSKANAKTLAEIVALLKTLDKDDLVFMQVMAERLAIPVSQETPEVEDGEIESDPFEEMGGDVDPEDDDDADPFADAPEGDDDDADPFAEEGEPEGDDDDADPFAEEEEEPKPVGRRSRKVEAKPEPKAPAKPKPAAKALKEVPAPNPIVRMTKKDTDLEKRNVMGRKLLELGIIKDAMPDTESETLHRGLRFIFSKAYGPKALSLEALVSRAAKAGIEVKFPKGNRGEDLKKQAILVTLMNEGVIDWPGSK